MAAAVITFVSPATGATPPTQASVALTNLVIAQAVFAVGATVATINHNLNVNALNLTNGFPKVTVTQIAGGTAGNNPVVTVVDGNNITIAQAIGSANTGATYLVYIDRTWGTDR